MLCLHYLRAYKHLTFTKHWSFAMNNDNNKQDLKVLRHSAAHLLAHAVSELFPETKLTIGPATEEGFFYDCLPIENFKEEHLPLLEQRMREIAQRDYPLTHREISKDEARKIYKDNPYKLELIEGVPGDTVGLAEQGAFYDLCRGGHVESTGKICNFKLQSISGSYWRADRSGQPLQRISGTAFFTKEELDAYHKKQEELALYDHRRLGKQLDLFSFREEGPGFAFFHPKGMRVLNALVDYLRKLYKKYEYEEIQTPIMLSDELWQRSGHYAHYKENMYFSVIDERSYAIKPMNCPGAILVYDTRPRSYRELPLRLAEFGRVHRHELSGVLHGLFRVRSFVQDDAHIFCTPDQLAHEIKQMLMMVHEVFGKFDFKNGTFAVSTRPLNSMGSDELWERATSALKSSLEQLGIKYVINEGDGAFYGPKIDFSIEDTMGRKWQCSTIQVDFFQPENFDLHYVGSDGKLHRPVIAHRTIYGSLERFLGILLEHTKGHLPFFIAPVQVRVLTITDAFKEYAQTIVAKLKEAGIRVELDESSDPLSGQIKAATLEKIPWMLIVGQKEMDNNTVTLRLSDGKQQFGIPIAEIIEKAKDLNK